MPILIQMSTEDIQHMIEVLKNAFEDDTSDSEEEEHEGDVELKLQVCRDISFVDDIDDTKFPGNWYINDTFSIDVMIEGKDEKYLCYISLMGNPQYLDEMKEYIENFMKEKNVSNYSLK